MTKKRKLTKSRKTKKQFRTEDNQQKHTEIELVTVIDGLWTDARMRILWQTRKTQNQIIHRIAGSAGLKKERKKGTIYELSKN